MSPRKLTDGNYTDSIMTDNELSRFKGEMRSAQQAITRAKSILDAGNVSGTYSDSYSSILGVKFELAAIVQAAIYEHQKQIRSYK